MAYSNLGDVERINAEWTIKQEQSPVAYFDAARKAYLKSIECNKEEPQTYRSVAEVYHREAQWQIEQKQSAEASIAKGLQWVEKSSDMSAENPYTIALQGALFLLKAKTKNNLAERAQYASSATNAIEKAIKINPLLKKEYEPLLKEAKNLQAQ